MAKAQRTPTAFQMARTAFKAGKIVIALHPTDGKGVVREMFRSRGKDLITTWAGTITADDVNFALFSDAIEAQRFLNNQ